MSEPPVNVKQHCENTDKWRNLSTESLVQLSTSNTSNVTNTEEMEVLQSSDHFGVNGSNEGSPKPLTSGTNTVNYTCIRESMNEKTLTIYPSTSGTSSVANVNAASLVPVNNFSANQSLLTQTKDAQLNDKRELSLPEIKLTPVSKTTILWATNWVNLNPPSAFKLNQIQWDLEKMLTSVIIRKNIIADCSNVIDSFLRNLHNDQTILFTVPADESLLCNSYESEISLQASEKKVPKESKFWSFAKSYTTYVTSEDYYWLEKLIKSYSDQKFYKIPPLGESYKKKWANEIIEMEQKANESVLDRVKRKSKYLIKLKSVKGSERLADLKTFLESNDKILPKLDDTFDEFYLDQNEEDESGKIKLINSCVLDASMSTSSSSDTEFNEDDHDEVLDEIKKNDDLLRKVQQQNLKTLQNLYSRCGKDYRKQFMQKKIDVLNSKILNSKRKSNESWTLYQKMTQKAKEDADMEILLQQRNDCIQNMHFFEKESYVCLEQINLNDFEIIYEKSGTCKVLLQAALSADDQVKKSVIVDQNAVKNNIKKCNGAVKLTKKRGRGRPPKKTSEKIQQPCTDSGEVLKHRHVDTKDTIAVKPTKKRGRGRPPKKTSKKIQKPCTDSGKVLKNKYVDTKDTTGSSNVESSSQCEIGFQPGSSSQYKLCFQPKSSSQQESSTQTISNSQFKPIFLPECMYQTSPKMLSCYQQTSKQVMNLQKYFEVHDDFSSDDSFILDMFDKD